MKFICADSKVSFTSWQWHGNGQEIRAGEFVALVFISVSNCSSDAPHTDWLQQAAKRRPQFLLKQRVCIFLHSVHCSTRELHLLDTGFRLRYGCDGDWCITFADRPQPFRKKQQKKKKPKYWKNNKKSAACCLQDRAA